VNASRAEKRLTSLVGHHSYQCFQRLPDIDSATLEPPNDMRTSPGEMCSEVLDCPGWGHRSGGLILPALWIFSRNFELLCEAPDTAAALLKSVRQFQPGASLAS